MPRKRRVCFVTGTRAEFGLMRTALEAIRAHPALRLQLVVTGMHLDPIHGRTLRAIRAGGWPVEAVVPWRRGSGRSATATAGATACAMRGMVDVFARLKPDIVLVVGDRVEPFAAAAAAHLSQRAIAHVHGGDRAAGQVDDSLRHAITKLAHIHFPATAQSAARLRRMGEDAFRIHRVGSPGVDGIEDEAQTGVSGGQTAMSVLLGRYCLFVLHPAEADARVEHRRARIVLDAVERVGFARIIAVYPNNDPGSAGIIRALNARQGDERYVIRRDVPRAQFLALMRDAAVLVGNSSSGIIEAASFGTPVVDIGDRQRGRETSGNVRHVEYDAQAIERILTHLWNGGRPRRSRCRNVYGGDGAGRRMADILSRIPLSSELRRKLIAH